MKELIKKITKKKEFSGLPEEDVEKAFRKFNKENYSNEEKMKLTRKLLREAFSSFSSQKLLNLKDKSPEWVLRKHLSTRERLPYYKEIYSRILENIGDCSIIDLGAGVNGFSYDFFGKDINYIAIEGIKQLVDLMNFYFKKENKKAKAYHLSLFELEKIKKLIKKIKGKKVVLLFKTVDSLEMLERNYSKKLLKEIVPLADKVVVSFATESFVKRKKFHAKRNWLLEFIKENFALLDEFKFGGESYLAIGK